MNKDKEPLMSAKEWLTFNPNAESYSDWVEQYAKYHTKWHLNNVKEVVCEEAIIFLPSHSHLHGAKLVDKQSITNAVEKYINENLKL